VEVTGKKLEIFVDGVHIGQTGERIPVEKFGAGVTALARQDNGDGTNTFSIVTDDLDAQVVFKENGKEVRIAEEDWIALPHRASSTGGRVIVKMRVAED